MKKLEINFITLRTLYICFICIFFATLDVLEIAFAKDIRDNPMTDITIEPPNIKGATTGVPNAAIASANNPVVAAIIPNCFHSTPFVASNIFLSAIPNKIKDELIITIAIDPLAIFVFDNFNFLNSPTFKLIIFSNNKEPIKAGIPVTAIAARYIDVAAI